MAVHNRKIRIGCDDLSALHHINGQDQPVTANLVTGIWALKQQGILKFQYQNIQGHQDDTTPNEKLDIWAQLNIQADSKAKEMLKKSDCTQ